MEPSKNQLQEIIDRCKSIKSIRREVSNNFPDFSKYIQNESYKKSESSDQVLFDYLYPEQIKHCTKTSTKAIFRNFRSGYTYCGKMDTCECAKTAFKKSISEKKKEGPTSKTIYKTIDCDKVQSLLNYKSSGEVAKELGIANITMRKIIEYHKLTVPELPQKLKHEKLYDREYVLQNLANMTYHEFAKSLGITRYYITMAVGHHKIEYSDILQRRRLATIQHDDLKDPDFIKEQLQYKSSRELGEDYNLTSYEIHHIIWYIHGIRNRWEFSQNRLYCKELTNKEWIEENLQSKPATLIAHELGLTPHKVYSAIRKHNIDMSNYSSSVSAEETLFFDEIKKIYDGDIIRNSRQIIPPYEIDIFLPKLNIAIEYNGIYWHSTKHKDCHYHQMKYKKCYDNDIDLIHVYSDEWDSSPSSILQHIKNLIQYKKTSNIEYLSEHIKPGLYIEISNDLGLGTLFKKLGYKREEIGEPMFIDECYYNAGFSRWERKKN